MTPFKSAGRSRSAFLASSLLAAALFAGAPAASAQPDPGDFLIVSNPVGSLPSGAIFRVIPSTGARSVLSSPDHTSQCTAAGTPLACCTGSGTSDGTPPCQQVGTGPVFGQAVGIAREASGTLIVTDGFLGALLRVDPATGNRTIISTPDRTSECTAAADPFPCCTGSGTGDGTPPCQQVGSGPAFSSQNAGVTTLFGVSIEATGSILVNDGFNQAMYRVDPVTGNRSVVSDAGTGTGPVLGGRQGVTVADGGAIYTVGGGGGLGNVLRVQKSTGDRATVSDSGTGSGPLWDTPIGIAVSPEGDLLVTNPVFNPRVTRVDPATGDRTDLVGTGSPSFSIIWGIEMDPTGDAIVAGGISERVWRLAPASGALDVVTGPSVVSDCTAAGVPYACCTGSGTGNGTAPCVDVGSGPSLDNPLNVAIVPPSVAAGIPGSALVLDAGLKAIVSVDPVSGDRALAAGGGLLSAVAIEDPQAVAAESEDAILVTDGALNALIRVDAEDGSATIVSGGGAVGDCTGAAVPYGCCTGSGTGDGTPPCDAARGSGEPFREIHGVAVEADGSILVTDDQVPLNGTFGSVLFRVNPLSGDRTIVSTEALVSACTGSGAPFACCTGSGVGNGNPPCAAVGSGGAGFSIESRDIALEADGGILITDINAGPGLHGIVRVHPSTGDRTSVSVSSVIGSGPSFQLPSGILVEADGEILVVDRDANALFRVDPATGDRTIISDSGTGTGENFIDPDGVSLALNGDILVADEGLEAVVRVNRTSGNRTIESVLDRTADCTGAGTPFACCTGTGTGNGSPPCADAGDGFGLGAPVDLAAAKPRVPKPGDVVVVGSVDFLDTPDQVFLVDPATGDRAVISSAGVGFGRTVDGGTNLAQAPDGSFVVGNQGPTPAVIRIDPATGNRTVVADPSTGSGLDMSIAIPFGIAVENDGDILIADAGFLGVVDVDPVSGDRAYRSVGDVTPTRCFAPGILYTCCTGSGTGNGTLPCADLGTGPAFSNPVGITLEADGDALVADNNLPALYRVDGAMGNRTIASSNDLTANCSGAGDPYACCTGAGTGNGTPPCTATGSGDSGFSPGGDVGVEADGDILVLSSGSVTRVDPATGDRSYASVHDQTSLCSAAGTPFSCCTGSGTGDGVTPPCVAVGSGPAFSIPMSLGAGSLGDIYVTDDGADAIYRVDPITGDRSILSDAATGAGPAFPNLWGILVLPGQTGEVSVGAAVGGSLLGGSSTAGGADYTFDMVEDEGDFSVVYKPTVAQQLADVIQNPVSVSFGLPTSPAQLWEVNFDGTFTGLLTLTFGYDETNLAPGVSETDLRINHFVGGQWVELSTVAQNTTANTITVQVGSLSQFALGAAGLATYVCEFGGTAQGGSIDFTVGGVFLSVATTNGQSASDVAAAVAAAINANGTLAAGGVTATAMGARVTLSNAVFTSTEVDDAGLTHGPGLIPALSLGGAAAFLLLLLAAVGLRRWRTARG